MYSGIFIVFQHVICNNDALTHVLEFKRDMPIDLVANLEVPVEVDRVKKLDMSAVSRLLVSKLLVLRVQV